MEKKKKLEIRRFVTEDGEVLPGPRDFVESWNLFYIEKYYSKKGYKESLKGWL